MCVTVCPPCPCVHAPQLSAPFPLLSLALPRHTLPRQMMAAISSSFIDEALAGIAAVAKARQSSGAVMTEDDLMTFLGECVAPVLRRVWTMLAPSTPAWAPRG